MTKIPNERETRERLREQQAQLGGAVVQYRHGAVEVVVDYRGSRYFFLASERARERECVIRVRYPNTHDLAYPDYLPRDVVCAAIRALAQF